MKTALLILSVIAAILAIGWLVGAKEEFLEIFTMDEEKD